MEQPNKHLADAHSDVAIKVDMGNLLLHCSGENSSESRDAPVPVDMSRLIHTSLPNATASNMTAPSVHQSDSISVIVDPSTIRLLEYTPLPQKPFFVVLCILAVLVCTTLSPLPMLVNAWAANKISLVRTAQLTQGPSLFSLIIDIAYFIIACCVSPNIKKWSTLICLLILTFIVSSIAGLLGLLGFAIIVIAIVVALLGLVIAFMSQL